MALADGNHRVLVAADLKNVKIDMYKDTTRTAPRYAQIEDSGTLTRRNMCR